MDEEQALRNKPKLPEARHCAKKLLKSCPGKPHTVLNDVVVLLKNDFTLIVRGTKEHLPPDVYAITHRDGDCTIIGYNENASITRQRFSVAHEIGHLLMGHLHGRSSIELDTQDNDEMEANAFAAELLMPRASLAKDIKAGIKQPDVLAKKYQVSSDAMWWQLSKTGLMNLL